ncbi:MAG: hypothetical protein MI741_03565, partial [Rhodospirillales bacterium]|nr:hypothetical protein [Rhodospirillales bacterium]
DNDQRLTGLLLGQTLHTRPEEIYRALIEATAFGARAIVERHVEYGVDVSEVINCGGIAEKNPLLMQIYADVIGKEMKISRSPQTCAIGSAIAASVVAGGQTGGHASFAGAQQAMCGVKEKTYKPQPEAQRVYDELYKLYMQLHDAFGVRGKAIDLFDVMKRLLQIKEQTLAS